MPRLNPFASGRTKLTKLWEGAIDGHVIALARDEGSGANPLVVLAPAG